MPFKQVPDQTLSDWDRICANLEASQKDDDKDDPAESDNNKPHFAEMSATAEMLFNFGHKMSLEYLP